MEVFNRLGWDPSKPTYGFNSGEPTRRGFGTVGSILGNAVFPGLGFITGPLTRGMVHLIQNMIANGASKDQIQQVYQQVQQQQPEQPTTPAAPATPPPTTPTAPHAGVGIDPWGNPADPGEWWSNDFGRWNTDEYGTTPGDYNLRGPGGQFGAKGLGFTTGANIGGSGTVGNLLTAIGWGGWGGSIGAGDISRFKGQAGYSRPYSADQWANMRGSMKYPAPALSNAFGGITPQMSYEDYVQGFHAPGTVGSSTGPGGAAVGGIGAPQGGFKTAVGHTVANKNPYALGTSDVNPGLKIFTRARKLQEGTKELESGPAWLPPGERMDPSPKEAAGIYDPGEQSDEDYNARIEADEDDLWEEELQRRRETMYKTVGVNINGEEVEIPIWDEDMTQAQAEDAARDRLELGLSPFASDMELDTAIENNSKRLGYAMGTSNVGLKLFYRKQLKRKKP